VPKLKRFLLNKYTVLALSLILLIVIFHPVILKKLGKSLIYETIPQKADIIIILAGGDGSRIRKGVELYKKGLAPKIMMAGGNLYYHKYYAEYMAEYAIYLGVPTENILLEKFAQSTYENAKFAYPIIKEAGYKKTLLVTSKFHTKRSYKIFRKLFDQNLSLYIVGADDGIDYDNWWRKYEMADTILIEWAKTVIYWFKSA
jgi:uncharacterized SAM-binding protein YcdF (DUF218 family)